MITVLVAEDRPLVRRGIIGFLNTHPDLTVVAEAGDGAEAVRKLQLTDRTQAAVHAWRHGVLRRETDP